MALFGGPMENNVAICHDEYLSHVLSQLREQKCVGRMEDFHKLEDNSHSPHFTSKHCTVLLFSLCDWSKFRHVV